MNLPNRIKNIAASQVKAIKDRLDRIDAESEQEALDRRAERDARSELRDAMDGPALRSPEDIAAGRLQTPVQKPTPAAAPSPSPAPKQESPSRLSPLAKHYRVLGLEDGADLGAVRAAYAQLSSRCDPSRFPELSEEEKQAVNEIKVRVDAAYDALRDALDPTAGRFDKLEL